MKVLRTIPLWHNGARISSCRRQTRLFPCYKGFILVYKLNCKDTHFPFNSKTGSKNYRIFFSFYFYFLFLSSQTPQCWTKKSNIKKLDILKMTREYKNINSLNLRSTIFSCFFVNVLISRPYSIVIVIKTQIFCTTHTVHFIQDIFH